MQVLHLPGEFIRLVGDKVEALEITWWVLLWVVVPHLS